MDVNEITAIRWECNKCHSAITYKLTETINLPQSCACGTAYVDSNTYSDYQHAVEFVARLKALRVGSHNIRASLKLELQDAIGGGAFSRA
jgi:hypothetical protein